MTLHVLEHSLAAHILAQLRAGDTSPQQFRSLTHALTCLLVVEATRTLPTRSQTIQTPLEPTEAAMFQQGFVAIPVLRAGLGMLDPVLELLPDVTVGYVGMARDEETAIAASYYCKLPPLEDKTVLLLDPMVATGGSAAAAIDRLHDAGARKILLLCVVAAPEGITFLTDRFPEVDIFAAALDRELNAQKYILPGLGDFGDRLYGTL